MSFLDLNFKVLFVLILAFGAFSFLFPFIATLLSALVKIFQSNQKPNNMMKSLNILVPAYSEEKVLLSTLNSIQSNIEHAQSLYTNLNISLTVALDGSKDSTPTLALGFANQYPKTKIIDRKINKGKWETIKELFSSSNSDWVAFVDCGTVWPEKFLVDMIVNINSCSSVGAAPGYQPLHAKKTETLMWKFELFMKQIENLSGGPVSLHGATMFFRSHELGIAFKYLDQHSQNETWLNDDVALSLAMRCQGEINYLGGTINVHDSGVLLTGNELTRRERMLLGNLQWIFKLWPNLILHHSIVGVLALRRIVRVLWAYNFIVILVFACLAIRLNVLSIFLVLLLFGSLIYRNARIRAAAIASLKTPLLLFSHDKTKPWA